VNRWTTVASRWLKRRRPASLALPAPRDPAKLEEAREAARLAWMRLEATKRQDMEVSDASLRADRLHRRNNLGPAMLRQLEGRG
jgi:hypothetical protein